MLIFGVSCYFSSEKYQSELHRYVDLQQHNKIKSLKSNWEWKWSDLWQLDSASIGEIDHHRLGCLLEWTLKEEKLKITRSDAFTLEGEFYWAHEKRFDNDTLFCQGHVHITNDGELLYKTLVYLSRTEFEKDNLLGELRPKILYYEIEIFDQGELISIYRSSNNQLNLDYGTRRMEFVPKDLMLIKGKDILNIEKTK